MTILNLEIRKEMLLLVVLAAVLTVFSVLTATGFDVVENAKAAWGYPFCWWGVCNH